MPHRDYPYPIPDDPEELAWQLEILLKRQENLENTNAWGGHFFTVCLVLLAIPAAIVIAMLLFAPSVALVVLGALGLAGLLASLSGNSWRRLLPLIGFPRDARPSDLLFGNRGYRRSDTMIVEEQIVAFASKLKEIREQRGLKGDWRGGDGEPT